MDEFRLLIYTILGNVGTLLLGVLLLMLVLVLVISLVLAIAIGYAEMWKTFVW